MTLFSRYLCSNSVFDCMDHATEFTQHNHLDEWMDCFSLKRKYGGQLCKGISKHFIWHDWKCGLPTITCRTSPFLKHKYITCNNQSQLDIDLDDFFLFEQRIIFGSTFYPKKEMQNTPGKILVTWGNQTTNQTFSPLRRL